jgi:hypothetical protein
MITDAGTVALSAESATVIPPGGADPFKLTVPVAGSPPTTEVGFTETLDSAAGVIVNVALCVTPAKVAVIVEVTVLA